MPMPHSWLWLSDVTVPSLTPFLGSLILSLVEPFLTHVILLPPRRRQVGDSGEGSSGWSLGLSSYPSGLQFPFYRKYTDACKPPSGVIPSTGDQTDS